MDNTALFEELIKVKKERRREPERAAEEAARLTRNYENKDKGEHTA